MIPGRHGRARTRGATLAMSLVLLALVTLLGLAGANAAHIELSLAQNLLFRENATAAASAGIESAIGSIVTATTPETVPTSLSSVSAAERFEVDIRFLGYDRALPQAPGAALAGARFEIVATGHAARNATDRQRAQVLLAVDAPPDHSAADCEPLSANPCHVRGQLVRLSWQRVAIE